MNILSFSRNLKVIIGDVALYQLRTEVFRLRIRIFFFGFFSAIRVQVFVLCLAGCSFLLLSSGCYSFTGGSIPAHLKTLAIPLADDTSGFGQAQLRETLTQQLIQNFRRDNAYTLVQDRSDALLMVAITNIAEATATVQQGEVERDKQVVVTVNVVYEDRVKQKTIWQKPLSSTIAYDIASGLQGRDAALQRALQQLSNDILLSVVSGW
jgi:Lipopolysaccharide-assembly